VALPCHNARDLPGLHLPNVREMALADIWRDSQAFNAYRGNDWMQEPCRSCHEKGRDLGGCRCQAFMLAGDAAATDPVCGKSPLRGQVDAVIRFAGQTGTVAGGGRVIEQPIVFRTDANSRQLSGR
jgi:pyrroloquinoline quinone biosynthesis protein E